MWKKKPGHEHDHIDARTGIHHIHLHNTLTDGEHHVQILLGAESCPACGRPWAKDELGQIDPKQVVAEALEVLSANHGAVQAYAQRHGVTLKVGPNAQMEPGHTLIQTTPGHKLLRTAKLPEDGQ